MGMLVKYHLYAPGPVEIPPEVLSEMSKPIFHHRTSQFSEVLVNAWEGLKYVFQTKQHVYILASSGTGAMNAAVENTLSEGDKVIVLSFGKFGERWEKICKAYGLNVITLKRDYGYCVEPEEVEKALKDHPDAKAVLLQHSETSTGVSSDLKTIASIVSRTDAILIVDGITSVGCDEVKMDDWGIDVLVGGSQKSFMIPPGLSFIALSEKAKKYMEKSNLPKFYFNLKEEEKAVADKTTAWTPGITLIMALNKAIELMKKEGIENVIQRHTVVSEAVREGVKALGLNLFCKYKFFSKAVTAVEVPQGIDGNQIPKLMRNKYGAEIAGGQGSMKGQIFRLGHLGYVDKGDVVVMLQALEFTLRDLGYKFEPGISLSAANKVLFEKYKF
ncbi:MAG: pyridoxal-phosphate-dependent aminotransferase family protein [Brevinematia bacterium]